MAKKTTPPPVEILVESVVQGIQEVKGEEIVVLDMREIPHAVSDFFVICHGKSNTQVDAIGRSVEHTTHQQLQDKPSHREGYGQANWVLLDYTNVVVHVFYKDARSFYGLEELWADAKREEIEYLT